MISFPGNATYVQQEQDYWSNQQAETQPACLVQPKCALDVSVALIVTRFYGCRFAVKSGGHACFVGASNIQGGLTIDLGSLDQVQVSEDKTLTEVGAGNGWVDVYSQLDPLGLSVVGGRVANIGVGGLTLGGMLGSSKTLDNSLIPTRRDIVLLWSSWLGLRWCPKLSSKLDLVPLLHRLLMTVPGSCSQR